VGWMARLGYFLPPMLSPDYGPELEQTIKRVRRHTMTTPRRIAALCDGVEHVARAGVPGAVVECGVWKGGSMMAAALTLMRLGATDRDLYLFDTFQGMPPPTEEDVFSAYDGYNPMRHWRRRRREGGTSSWHHVAADEVRRAVLSTGYPAERVHLVEGRVEETLPDAAPAEIALLRLDTDWYESTKHELEHLYPRLSPAGVLILDDYGHYEGARRAVDEYFDAEGGRPLLSRIDYTGRIGVKHAVR
jgi:O-methyltransferase